MDQNMLTQDAINEFLLSRAGLRSKTLAEYRRHLDLFRQAFPGELPTMPQSIQAWLNGQRLGVKGRQLAPESLHAYFRTLRAMYRQLQQWHPEFRNPMPYVRSPLPKSKAMRCFVNEELYALFNQRLTPRDRALLTLLLDIGPRASECANLRWQDIMPGFVILRGKTGERVAPITETTYRALELLRPGFIAVRGKTGERVSVSRDTSGRALEVFRTSSEYVFTGKRGVLSYEGIYKTVRRLCQQAGITGSRASPHTFRHTFATHYAASDSCDAKVLQAILGHRDFKTTLQYIQNNPLRMARNHQECTPVKKIAGLAQANLFPESGILAEAQEIIAARIREA